MSEKIDDDAAPRTFIKLAEWYAENIGLATGEKLPLSKAVKAWNDYKRRGTGQLIVHPATGTLVTGFFLPATDLPATDEA